MEVELDDELPLREWDEVNSCQDGHVGVYNVYLDGFEALAAIVFGHTSWQEGSSHAQDDT